MDNLLVYLAVSLLINIGLFLPAFAFKTDKLTDASYSLTFVTLALIAFNSSGKNLYDYILLAMILLWALRLGAFLVVRIRKTKRDKRFDEMRGSFNKFLRFWLLQALTVWIVLIPALMFFNNPKTTTPLIWAGILVWLFGLTMETIADYQKWQFMNRGSKTWIDEGLWKYSRHPNYLGEMLVWIGVYIFCFDSLDSSQKLIGIVGPLFIVLLLLFVSGIPILEKAADNRWGTDKKYIAYKKHTSVLIPRLSSFKKSIS